MHNKLKNKGSKLLILILFILGFGLSVYPFVGSWFMAYDQSQVVGTYTTENKKLSKAKQKEMIEQAQKYNSLLFQTQGAVVGDSETNLSHERYEALLSTSDSGIMATLEIPKIDVNLPIYHGVEDDVLSIGVGHIEGTSLPVGGKNTHCVVSGHRGLPSSKLFTRLDELADGDLFYIHVLDDTLAYQVDDIQVVEPDDVDSIQIQPDKDLVSLVTCTPYGLNTHRMIVTGHRVTYKEKQKQEIQQAIPSIRELVFMSLPFIFLIVLIVLVIAQRRKGKENK